MEITTITRGGREQKAYRVFLVTDNGATGYVDVPSKDWKPEKLKKLLSQKAEELDLAFTV